MSSLDTQERKASIRERKSRGGAKSDFFICGYGLPLRQSTLSGMDLEV